MTRLGMYLRHAVQQTMGIAPVLAAMGLLAGQLITSVCMMIIIMMIMMMRFLCLI
jgi:hypothetical protein